MGSNIDNRKIAKNSIFLYIRMIILMFVNLYTSRIVLEALGVVDYGIYSAVAGFIAMFSLISASISSAINRYLAYTIGERDNVKLSRTFSTSIIILLGISLIVLVLADTVGLWFLNTKMTIPPDKFFAANCVYQLSLITFAVNLLSVPYSSLLIAHEKMGIFAYIGIVEGILNLAIAYAIKIDTSNRLILYALLICLVAIFIRILYGSYCKKQFRECQFKFIIDKPLIINMFGFAGWNFIGTTAGVLRMQGINILFNVFVGPVINAAYGLSLQILNAINKLSSNFYMAVQPQITKSFAAGERIATFNLVCQSSRLAYYLLFLIVLPFVCYTKDILSLWLTEIPESTTAFSRIMAIFCLTESFSQPLIYLMLANGKIRNYQLIVGGIGLINFPVAWLLIRCGINPTLVLSTIIVFSIISLFVRLIMLKMQIGFSIREFIISTIIRVIAVTCLSLIMPFVIQLPHDSIFRLFVNIFLIVVSTIVIIYLIGLSKTEKIYIKSKLHI